MRVHHIIWNLFLVCCLLSAGGTIGDISTYSVNFVPGSGPPSHNVVTNTYLMNVHCHAI